MRKGGDDPSSIKERIGTGLIILTFALMLPTLVKYENETKPEEVYLPTYTSFVGPIKPEIKVESVREEIPREIPRTETVLEYARRRNNEVFGEQHWKAHYRLVLNESGWRPNAQNPRSTAYGLYQFLNSTWSGYGCVKTPDPKQQIECGIKYIKGRYGNPTNALNFWLRQKPHWY